MYWTNRQNIQTPKIFKKFIKLNFDQWYIKNNPQQKKQNNNKKANKKCYGYKK